MKSRSRIIVTVAALLIAAGLPVFAERPAKPPTGMGKFILFLKQAPPVPPGQTRKKIVAPDIAKLGGIVLEVRDEYRTMFLPLAAVKHVRKDDNVDYMQRVWMGETQEEWNATEMQAEVSPSIMRLRPDSLTETASWGPKFYSYDGSGNIRRITELDANQDVKTVGTETYRYDRASRLTEAVVNGITETYSYDAFGNLTQKQTGNYPPANFPVEMASNRISTLTYDIAGNVTSDPNKRYGSYMYDSLGMLVGMYSSGGPKRMYYTADDERIGFSVANSLSRWMIRDFEGRPLREFRISNPINDLEDAPWIWVEDYVYAGEQLVGGETAGPYGENSGDIPVDRRRRHFHLDHLGSVRLVTTDTGSVALGVHNYYPYGAEQTALNQEALNFGGNIRPEPRRFTGHERDFNGPGNIDNDDYIDYMHARYYDPFAGRFLSPDPVLDLKHALTRPQGWNRYSYVENNPTYATDPNGKCGNFLTCALTVASEASLPAAVVVTEAVAFTGALYIAAQISLHGQAAHKERVEPVVIPKEFTKRKKDENRVIIGESMDRVAEAGRQIGAVPLSGIESDKATGTSVLAVEAAAASGAKIFDIGHDAARPGISAPYVNERAALRDMGFTPVPTSKTVRLSGKDVLVYEWRRIDP